MAWRYDLLRYVTVQVMLRSHLSPTPACPICHVLKCGNHTPIQYPATPQRNLASYLAVISSPRPARYRCSAIPRRVLAHQSHVVGVDVGISTHSLLNFPNFSPTTRISCDDTGSLTPHETLSTRAGQNTGMLRLMPPRTDSLPSHEIKPAMKE